MCLGRTYCTLGAHVADPYLANHQLSQLDKELSKYPTLNNFEKQTSVPKAYMVLGLGALYFFLIFFNIGGEFLVNTAGFVIPAYYSLDALFSSGKADDTQVSLPTRTLSICHCHCCKPALTHPA